MKERELFRIYCFKFVEQTFEENENLPPGSTMIVVKSTVDDGYIGQPTGLKYFFEHDITPQGAYPENPVCCIGFSEREQKWYGWALRAIQGFGVGSTIKKGECGYREDRREWTAETLEDAKQMAICFAEDVNISFRFYPEVNE